MSRTAGKRVGARRPTVAAEPLRIAPRIFFVGELHDHDERVGSQEVVAHLEKRHVQALERRARRIVVRHVDRVVRIRLDEELAGKNRERKADDLIALLERSEMRPAERREQGVAGEPRRRLGPEEGRVGVLRHPHQLVLGDALLGWLWPNRPKQPWPPPEGQWNASLGSVAGFLGGLSVLFVVTVSIVVAQGRQGDDVVLFVMLGVGLLSAVLGRRWQDQARVP